MRRGQGAERRRPVRTETDGVPMLGCGLGLRRVYIDEILSRRPTVDWFEIISENHMDADGNPQPVLERVRAEYPLVMHCVSMSLASTDPLDMDHLRKVKTLAERIEPAWISDHVAWTSIHGVSLHELLPVPYTQESLDHVVERISRVQDFLGRRLVVENVSSYVSFRHSEMPEHVFIAELVKRADCNLLLDVNNVVVAGFNHGFDPRTYIDAIPADRVVQFHVAGHTDMGTHRVDTHDEPVGDEAWELYRYARHRCPQGSPMIERDDPFPPFDDLLAELALLRTIDAEVAAEAARSAA